MIRIGTRGSDLALWQAKHVATELQRVANEQTELVIVKTSGDRMQDVPLTPELGRGFFTKEIEEGLLAGDFDLAVHSLKDLAVEMPAGLRLAAVLRRAPAGELLLVRPEAHLAETESLLPLARGATVGTSSPRRRKFLLFQRRDLTVKDLRGNVPTRLRKLREGEYDAILVATAGVSRLGLNLSGLFAVDLPPSAFPGAPGQGALAIQARARDHETLKLVGELTDAQTWQTTAVERGLLAALGGGCSLPLGAYCEQRGDRFRLRAFLFHVEREVPLVVDLEDRRSHRLVARAKAELMPALQGDLSGLRFATLRGRKPLRLEDELRAAGAEVYPVACYETETLSIEGEDLAWICEADALLLASHNGARALAEALAGRGALRRDAILVVPGGATAEIARRAFPQHEVLTADPPRSEGMGQLAVARGARRIALLGAEGGNTEGARIAVEAGLDARHFPLYRNRPIDSISLDALPPGVIPFYMSRSAVLACPAERFPDAPLVVAIGPTTSEVLRSEAPIRVARTPDLPGVLALAPRLKGQDRA